MILSVYKDKKEKELKYKVLLILFNMLCKYMPK